MRRKPPDDALVGRIAMSRVTVLAQLRRAKEELAEAKAALAVHERGDPSQPGFGKDPEAVPECPMQDYKDSDWEQGFRIGSQ